MRSSPRRQPLERLDALAGDFHVRLGLAESFARRIERDRRVGDAASRDRRAIARRRRRRRRRRRKSASAAGARARRRAPRRTNPAGRRRSSRAPGAGSVLRILENAGRRSIASSSASSAIRPLADVRAPMAIASMISMSERDNQRRLDERAPRGGAKRQRRPRRRVRRDERALGSQARREALRRYSDRASTRPRGGLTTTAPTRRPPRMRKYVPARGGTSSVSPSAVRCPSAVSDRVRPARARQAARRDCASITCPGSPTSRSVSTLPSHGTNVARTGRFVASGDERRPDEHVARSRDDPRVAPDDRERLRRRAGLRDEIVANARPSRRRSRCRAPSTRRCDARRIATESRPARARDSRRRVARDRVGAVMSAGSARKLVGRDDADVVAVDDRAQSDRSTSIALFTNGPARGRDRDAGRRSDPDREVPNVVARQLVGLELHRAGDPTALRRRRAHDDFFVRRGGAARERASVERDAIRRRIARQKARRDRAARRPAHRTRFGERHGVIRRRRDRWARRAESARRRSTAACCHSLRWPSVSSAIWRASSPAAAHDARRARQRRRGIARAGDRLEPIDLVAQRARRCRRARVRRSSRATDGRPRCALRQDVARHRLELIEQWPAVDHRRRAQRVVDHDGDRRRRVARADPARHRPRRGDRRSPAARARAAASIRDF